MKILVVGSGGREHALVDRLADSPRAKRVYCAPGNAGTGRRAENVPIEADDLAGLADFATRESVDLTIVGPEAPLCAGIVDRFESVGLRVFGPTAAAARIEGDKAFAKEIMHRCRVPTAEGRCFERYADAKTYIATRDTPQVVKAAGLAAGKGVVVCDDPADAIVAAEEMMIGKRFGDAGKRIVVEEKLNGQEVSVFALVDGCTIYLLETAQDHKRLGDGDTGPNTGGMGAYSPAPIATDAVVSQIVREVIVPTIDGLRGEGAPYRGVLYAGLMLTPGGPKVLEFNCRFGDPEAQVVLPRLKTDLVEVIEATVTGKLDTISLAWDTRPAVCVVMASGGYPGKYDKGLAIEGLAEAASLDDVHVFHAGTKPMGDRPVTWGGRVLSVTALGNTFTKARERAYEAVDKIDFEGACYRTDIGVRAEMATVVS